MNEEKTATTLSGFLMLAVLPATVLLAIASAIFMAGLAYQVFFHHFDDFSLRLSGWILYDGAKRRSSLAALRSVCRHRSSAGTPLGKSLLLQAASLASHSLISRAVSLKSMTQRQSY
jgi:hypothetical protein